MRGKRKIVVTLKLLNRLSNISSLYEKDMNKNISVSRLTRVINQKSVLIAVSTALEKEKKFTYAPR